MRYALVHQLLGAKTRVNHAQVLDVLGDPTSLGRDRVVLVRRVQHSMQCDWEEVREPQVIRLIRPFHGIIETHGCPRERTTVA